MKITLAALLATLLAGPCLAQSTVAPATPAPATAEAPAGMVRDRSEPDVKRTRIEDQGSRIDELRVRGQTQRVVVTPKAPGSKPYEIIMGNAGQTVPDGTGGASSAVGKRVWSVLDF
jgi:hypothetical protein